MFKFIVAVMAVCAALLATAVFKGALDLNASAELTPRGQQQIQHLRN